MLGTSFIGSSCFWTSVPGGSTGSGVYTLLVYISAAGAFCVQWFKTSKGVEIDPQTGQVVVIQPVLPVNGGGAEAIKMKGKELQANRRARIPSHVPLMAEAEPVAAMRVSDLPVVSAPASAR